MRNAVKSFWQIHDELCYNKITISQLNELINAVRCSSACKGKEKEIKIYPHLSLETFLQPSQERR